MEGFATGATGNATLGEDVFDGAENTYLAHLFYTVVDLLLDLEGACHIAGLE